MNKLIEVHGALDALRTIKISGRSLFAEPRVYENFTLSHCEPLTADVITRRLADDGIDAVVEISERVIRITIAPDRRPVGELVGVLRMASVDYV